MARIKLQLPDTFQFQTSIKVRVSDINYGNHLGNDKVLALAHEARVRYLNHFGFTEFDVDGVGIIMTDAAIMYFAESFLGEELDIHVTTSDFAKFGCDFLYKFENKLTQKEIARVKTGIVFFDYAARKMAHTPQKFIDLCYSENKTIGL